MAKAIWNGVVIAESDDIVMVDGNHYFPRESVKSEFLQESDRHTVCFWKGEASYYNIVVNGSINLNAAWYYPKTKPKADMIRDRIAFWRGVEIAP